MVGQLVLIGLVVVLGSPGLRNISPHGVSGWVGFLLGVAGIVIGAWW